MIRSIRQSPGYKWWAFWTVGIALFVMVMDFSVTFLALSTIAEEFQVTLRAVTWVALSSSIVITALLMPLGRLSDVTGRKSFHIAGMVFFAVGAIICSVAPSLQVLIAGRVVMAIGGAMGQAVVMAIVTSVFPNRERGKALGTITTAVAIGATVGPIIAGPIIQAFGWRAIFIALAIPTIAAVSVAVFILDDRLIGSNKVSFSRLRFDWQGSIFSAIALSLMILTIANPFGLELLSLPIIASVIAFFVLVAAFILRERRAPSPMLNLSFFSNSVFAHATVVRLLGFMGIAAMFFLMPIILQSFLGYSPQRAGLLMFINALSMGLSAQISGRLSDRINSYFLIIPGMVGLLATNLIVAFATPSLSFLGLALLLSAYGIFMGMWMPPNMSLTIGAVERKHYGQVSAFVNLLRNIGSITSQALGVAIITGVMASRGVEVELSRIGESAVTGVQEAFVDGWRIAFIVLSVFIFIALLFSLRSGIFRKKDAEVEKVSHDEETRTPAVAGQNPSIRLPYSGSPSFKE